ncbi:osteoclast stimulatory transmembrane protein isoform X1 [Petromyzon marinus]|uniref:osteoclast stimulatory transmembrane protein isoform X1 n=1 Tax=Petromyzon marinus TaxID=7757 RepID=UPI003F6F448A
MRRRDSAMRKHSPQQNRPPLATMNDSRDRPKVTFCASAQLLRAAYSVYRLPHATTRGERGLLLALCLLTSTLSSCFVLKVVWEAEEVRPPIRLGVTATYVALTAALLFSSKQLRCISLLVVPALGTKRGREYILYAAAGLLAVHTAPNTFHNLRALGEVSLCKALSGIRSVINNSARREAVVREYATVETQTVKGLLQFHSVQSNYVFDVKTRDVSTELDSLRLKVENVTRNVAANFKTFQATVEKVRAVLSTVFSVASVLLVLALSAAYLRSYLTNVLFDNIYITEELRALARQTDPSGEAMRCLKADGRRQLVDSTSLRLSRKETENWPLSILTLFTWLLLVSLAIGVEYGVYALTDTLLALADTIPPAHAEVRLYYEARLHRPDVSKPALPDESAASAQLHPGVRAVPHGAVPAGATRDDRRVRAAAAGARPRLPGLVRLPPAPQDRRLLLPRGGEQARPAAARPDEDAAPPQGRAAAGAGAIAGARIGSEEVEGCWSTKASGRWGGPVGGFGIGRATSARQGDGADMDATAEAAAGASIDKKMRDGAESGHHGAVRSRYGGSEMVTPSPGMQEDVSSIPTLTPAVYLEFACSPCGHVNFYPGLPIFTPPHLKTYV